MHLCDFARAPRSWFSSWVLLGVLVVFRREAHRRSTGRGASSGGNGALQHDERRRGGQRGRCGDAGGGWRDDGRRARGDVATRDSQKRSSSHRGLRETRRGAGRGGARDGERAGERDAARETAPSPPVRRVRDRDRGPDRERADRQSRARGWGERRGRDARGRGGALARVRGVHGQVRQGGLVLPRLGSAVRGVHAPRARVPGEPRRHREAQRRAREGGGHEARRHALRGSHAGRVRQPPRPRARGRGRGTDGCR